MAITSETSTITYPGNNSTLAAYVVPFVFFKDQHLEVVVTDEDGAITNLDLVSDYTVTGEGDEDGGTVRTLTAWDNTHTITINRSAAILQPFVFEEGQRLPMKTLEKALDWIVYHCQRIMRTASTALDSIVEHTGDIANPHAVTKAQVGLGNVDNTSDVAKPISTATQTALNGKSELGHLHTYDSITAKPATFAPSAHSHSYGDIIDPPDTVETTSSILAKIGDGTTISTQYLPDALQGYGPPVAPIFTVTGTAVDEYGGTMNGTYSPIDIINGATRFAVTDDPVAKQLKINSEGKWVLSWPASDGGKWTATTATLRPDQAIGWVASDGATGIPTIAFAGTFGHHRGIDYWDYFNEISYKWNGTVWARQYAEEPPETASSILAKIGDGERVHAEHISNGLRGTGPPETSGTLLNQAWRMTVLTASSQVSSSFATVTFLGSTADFGIAPGTTISQGIISGIVSTDSTSLIASKIRAQLPSQTLYTGKLWSDVFDISGTGNEVIFRRVTADVTIATPVVMLGNGTTVGITSSVAHIIESTTPVRLVGEYVGQSYEDAPVDEWYLWSGVRWDKQTPNVITATKYTLTDDDGIEIRDSAASGERKLTTFESVFSFIKSIIDLGQTWAGVHSFTSTTRPTSSGTGTPADNSLITLGDGIKRTLFFQSPVVAPAASVGYLPLGFGRLSGGVAYTYGSNDTPAAMLPFCLNAEFAKISVNHTAGYHASAVLEIAIYLPDLNGKPHTLLQQGSVPFSTALGRKTWDIPTPVNISGLFYVAMRPSIGNTEWAATGGTGTPTIMGSNPASCDISNFLFGSVDPSTMSQFHGSLLLQYVNTTHPFPATLPVISPTGALNLCLIQTASGGQPLCAIHN